MTVDTQRWLCPACGRPTKLSPAKFEMRAFVFTASALEGQIGYSIVPDGVVEQTCWTNDGCGETFVDGEGGHARDVARETVERLYGAELRALLEKIRECVKL